MLRLREYCERVRDDAYGGSIELVEDGITAMENELGAAGEENVICGSDTGSYFPHTSAYQSAGPLYEVCGEV